MTAARRFTLVRHVDVSGVSGTGVVAEGIQFSDGSVALHWYGEFPTTTVFESVEAVTAVHGHGGATVVTWIDTTPSPRMVRELSGA